MLRFLLPALAVFASLTAVSQTEPTILPRWATPEEIEQAERDGYVPPVNSRAITTPPANKPNIRAAAEWEEVQALTIAWEGYTGILKQIVRAAVVECQVIILTETPATTQSFLLGTGWGGPVDLTNVEIIQTNMNSIWMRDYGANTVYGNEVDDLFLVDWVYNRPRPFDDVSPQTIADFLNLELYTTTTAPWNLWNTGGNYMSNGNGQAFASELILDENQGGTSSWGAAYPNHSEAQIDNIMNAFMGTDEYIKMTVLPFDGINHIDMHMKIIDEETILFAEYPQGVSDGPQIEANIQYIQNNFTTRYGTPYRIVRLPAPPQQSNGNYPPNGWYNTYTNGVFINKTYLVPTYYEQYDTTALRILAEELPGYTIVPIDVDNSGQALISAGGAIHCITHTVGVADPMLITYPRLPDTNDDQNSYSLTAYVNHTSGVAQATLYHTTDLDAGYQAVAMSAIGGNQWQGSIPAQAFGSRVYYYVEGVANSGKVQVYPITAPEGYRSFRVINEVFGCTDPLACNYNADATIDNGSCIAGGCTNPDACNFDPTAECDNGTCAATAIALTLTTDCWGGEVSWNITSNGGTVAANTPQNTYGNQQTAVWNGCIPAGCYTFAILDGFGDGMAGGTLYSSCSSDGDYQMTNDSGAVLFEMANANYGFGTTHSFCIEALDPPVQECMGDFDNDGLVATSDLVIMLANFQCTGTCVADLNGDNAVNVSDVLIFLSLFGTNCN